MMILYNFVHLLFLPIYVIFVLFRLVRKKENIRSLANRFALYQSKRPDGTLIWLHGASLGEVIVATTLIKAISAKNPKYHFLVTTNTLSSAQVIKKANLPNVQHQFIPVDNFIFIKSFLRNWQPNMGIFMESELWPCLVHYAAKRCKLIIAGGRLSDKSFAAWLKAPALFRQIVNNFDLILLQSSKDLEKYNKLGISNAINLGNPKFSNQKLQFDHEKKLLLENSLKGKHVFVAASTHKEDEEVILAVIKELKNRSIDFYPIIVLRHPERRKEIANHCQNLHLKYSLRSDSALPDLGDDIYIVDSFGELGLFYSISDISFVGGSFKIGGHNLLEPAYFKNVIIVGPDMSNFHNITEEMLAKGAIFQIKNKDELLDKIIFCLESANASKLKQMQEIAEEFVQDKAKVVDRYLDKIKQIMAYDKA